MIMPNLTPDYIEHAKKNIRKDFPKLPAEIVDFMAEKYRNWPDFIHAVSNTVNPSGVRIFNYLHLLGYIGTTHRTRALVDFFVKALGKPKEQLFPPEFFTKAIPAIESTISEPTETRNKEPKKKYKCLGDQPDIAALFKAYRDEATGKIDYQAIVALMPRGRATITAEELENFGKGDMASAFTKGQYSSAALAVCDLVNTYRREWGKPPVKIGQLFVYNTVKPA